MLTGCRAERERCTSRELPCNDAVWSLSKSRSSTLGSSLPRLALDIMLGANDALNDIVAPPTPSTTKECNQVADDWPAEKRQREMSRRVLTTHIYFKHAFQ